MKAIEDTRLFSWPMLSMTSWASVSVFVAHLFKGICCQMLRWHYAGGSNEIYACHWQLITLHQTRVLSSSSALIIYRNFNSLNTFFSQKHWDFSWSNKICIEHWKCDILAWIDPARADRSWSEWFHIFCTWPWASPVSPLRVQSMGSGIIIIFKLQRKPEALT
jgi:hypothetical protein